MHRDSYLRLHTNPLKLAFEGFACSCQNKRMLISHRQLVQLTDFWYRSIFHLSLIEDDNKSHNFTNSHFCYVTLCYSIQSGLSWMNNHSIYSSLLIFINIFIDWFIIHTPDNVQTQILKPLFVKILLQILPYGKTREFRRRTQS